MDVTMRSRLRRLAGATAALVLAAGAAVAFTASPAQATGPGPYGDAFVWLDTPDPEMCVVPGDHQWNSTSSTPANEVCQTGTGAYSVYLPGVAAPAGTVQVTAYGADAVHCKVANWGPSGNRQQVNVRCFNTSGALANSRFVLSYTNVTGNRNHALAYLWANKPTSPSYTPALNYQYNSTGAANTITRFRAGYYQVFLPGLQGQTSGNIQVTAYGTGAEWCTNGFTSWGGNKVQIDVHCFDAAGQPADSRFTLSYVRDGNILGESVCCHPDGHPTAYTLGFRPSEPEYAPDDLFTFDFTSSGRIRRLSTGRYEVDSGHGIGDSAVHVTTETSPNGGSRCKLESFGTNGRAIVRCTTPAGAATDEVFSYHQVGPFVVG